MSDNANETRGKWVEGALIGILLLTLFFNVASRMITAPDPEDEAVHLALANVRAAIEVYEREHEGRFPTDLTQQLTRYTDIHGNISETRDDRYRFGPYINAIPGHGLSDDKSIAICEADAGRAVWRYDAETGYFGSEDPRFAGQ